MNLPAELAAGGASRRRYKGRALETACAASIWVTVAVLAVLLGGIVWQAWGWLDWGFVTSFDSRHPHEAGVLSGIWGSFWLIAFTALFSVPIGIGAALYLEEYAKNNWQKRLIQVNLANLAGVPSIVYGILGLTVFVRMFDVFRNEPLVLEVPLVVTRLSIRLPFGESVIAGALTLSLLILPMIIVASQEALRAVPASLRHASLALGASRWQTVCQQVLPAALPGIMTGVILALSRAIGETAPLVMVGAVTYVAFTPGGITNPGDVLRNPQGLLDVPFDSFTALPIQIFNWVSRPQEEYQHVAAAGIAVLLFVLLALNAAAILTRQRYQNKMRW